MSRLCRHTGWATGFTLLLHVVLTTQLAAEVKKKESTPAQTNSAVPDVETWDAIEQSAERYVKAFNTQDAKRLAGLYAENAELTDAAGNVFQGRETIRQEYEAFFQAHPKAQLSLDVSSLHFVTPNMVIEQGQAETQLSIKEPSVLSRYTAVHVKEKDGWRLASVQDFEVPGEAGKNLEQLAWLVGRWVDEADDSLMEIDCYWHESGSYLIRDFNIRVKGLLATSGTERIGWDPLRQQVRSWLFDIDGGYLEAAWIHDGTKWTVTTQGFRADGKPSQATYVVTPLRQDAYHMASFNRAAGQERLAELDMTVVRRPPEPSIPAKADPENARAESKEEIKTDKNPAQP